MHGLARPGGFGVEVPSLDGTELGSPAGCDGTLDALDVPPPPVTGRPSDSEPPGLIAQ